MDSLNAVCKTAGVKLRHYSIGSYSTCSAKVEFRHEEVGELTGRRAMAWLENNLFGKLRLPHGKSTLRGRRYGHRAGRIPACPLTGVCFDEDMLEHLRKAVRMGDDLNGAFESLADVAGRLLEEDEEQASSEESFEANCGDGYSHYTEEGQNVAA